MAIVAVPFTHFDLACKKGDEIPDDDPLVALAPHLFVQPGEEPKKKASKKQPGGQPPKPKEA